MTRALARRLITDRSGKKIAEVEIEHQGETVRVSAETFIVSCGAVNSSALLLRSACAIIIQTDSRILPDWLAEITWSTTTPP